MNGRRSSAEGGIASSAALLEAHIPGLRSFARALLRGDLGLADDLVQDTLERALSRWHLRRFEGDLRGWLYTILYNRFLSDRGRRKVRSTYEAMTKIVEDKPTGVDGEQEWALAHRDLVRAFAQLPDEQRSVLLLIAVEDFTYKEAARILGVPIGTVMSRLSRGRERLRQHMDGHRASGRSRLPSNGHTPCDAGATSRGRKCAGAPQIMAAEGAPLVAE